ncbi:MAG: hypothetical protein ACRC2S_06060 [Waterburya sp.]
MEWEKVIKHKLAIWITNYRLVESYPIAFYLNGSPIDGYFGFGNPNISDYSGKVILLSPSYKKEIDMSIERIHTTKEVWRWKLEGIKILPNIPFLISSDLDLKIIFDGYIEFIDQQDIIDIFEPEDYAYAVVSNHYFGIITVEENQKVSFTAFSSNPDAAILPNDEIWTLEWDCSMGRIRIVQ